MDTVTRIHSVRERVAEWRKAGARIGFVPTMGNLHKGHLSLLARAAEHADRLVVSVFVNPLQFGPNEDFSRYPRTLEHDTALLEQTPADLLFTPTAFEMYPMGVERTSLIDVPELTSILEGQIRPGHFAGVVWWERLCRMHPAPRSAWSRKASACGRPKRWRIKRARRNARA